MTQHLILKHLRTTNKWLHSTDIRDALDLNVGNASRMLEQLHKYNFVQRRISPKKHGRVYMYKAKRSTA